MAPTEPEPATVAAGKEAREGIVGHGPRRSAFVDGPDNEVGRFE